MTPLFSSDVFDLGIDEVSQPYNGSRWVADKRCRGKDPVILFAEYVNRLADYVSKKGKIPLVNSTPLFYPMILYVLYAACSNRFYIFGIFAICTFFILL